MKSELYLNLDTMKIHSTYDDELMNVEWKPTSRDVKLTYDRLAKETADFLDDEAFCGVIKNKTATGLWAFTTLLYQNQRRHSCIRWMPMGDSLMLVVEDFDHVYDMMVYSLPNYDFFED